MDALTNGSAEYSMRKGNDCLHISVAEKNPVVAYMHCVQQSVELIASACTVDVEGTVH
jgi:hypothetical protein